jgi:hypothetical protein
MVGIDPISFPVAAAAGLNLPLTQERASAGMIESQPHTSGHSSHG